MHVKNRQKFRTIISGCRLPWESRADQHAGARCSPSLFYPFFLHFLAFNHVYAKPGLGNTWTCQRQYYLAWTATVLLSRKLKSTRVITLKWFTWWQSAPRSQKHALSLVSAATVSNELNSRIPMMVPNFLCLKFWWYCKISISTYCLPPSTVYNKQGSQQNSALHRVGHVYLQAE